MVTLYHHQSPTWILDRLRTSLYYRYLFLDHLFYLEIVEAQISFQIPIFYGDPLMRTSSVCFETYASLMTAMT